MRKIEKVTPDSLNVSRETFERLCTYVDLVERWNPKINSVFLRNVARELRIAIPALASLVGRIDVETLLDEIFASFCLGK